MKTFLKATVSALALTAAIGLGSPADAAAAESIVRDPAEVPAPITRTEPKTLKVTLETVERVAELNDGSEYCAPVSATPSR